MTTTRRTPIQPSRATRERHAPDEQQFQQLYQEHQRLISGYLYRWVGNREDVEDLTVLIFLKAWQKGDFLRNPRAIQKWLFQVAHTTIADYWRIRSRERSSSLEELLGTDWGDRDQEEAPGTLDKLSGFLQRNLPHLSTGSPEELLAARPENACQAGLARPDHGPGDRVERLLQALPERYRAVLVCRYLQGLSIRETADKMGMTVANVKVLQCRALRRATTLGQVASASGE